MGKLMGRHVVSHAKQRLQKGDSVFECMSLKQGSGFEIDNIGFRKALRRQTAMRTAGGSVFGSSICLLRWCELLSGMF